MSDADDNDWDNNEMENGHITTTDDDNSSDEETFAPETSEQFDTDLPTAHRYLGKLNNVSGYTLYDDGEIVQILAIQTNTLVFPGFTLPLLMSNYQENTVMQNYLEKNNVFALLCADESFSTLFNCGVTMEIFETQMRNRSLNIKARGRQRCKLLPGFETKVLAGRLQQVTVKIFAEPEYLSPIGDTQFLALKAKHLYNPSDFEEVLKSGKYRKYHLCQYPLASWVYNKYEISYYVKQIIERLSNYIQEYIPKDPVKLSYWVVQNYPLMHIERLRILEKNSALERLQLELRYFRMERKICCRSCGAEITEPNKVFPMSKDGIQSNYVNPGGHVYETVTVSEAKNYELRGSPSTQFSWFPGYAWTVMQCKDCYKHLGWRFTSSHLKPKSFFGLAKSGFRIDVMYNDELSDDLRELFRKRGCYSYTEQHV